MSPATSSTPSSTVNGNTHAASASPSPAASASSESQRITLFKEQLTPDAEKSALLNWAGTRALATLSQVRSPASLAELQHLVRAHDHVRPVGSRLTYEALTCIDPTRPNAIMVDLSNLHGLISMTDNTATFWAGTSIDKVSEILKQHGKYINCSPGVIGVQTLAGAIGTGTHGQGLGQSFLCDIVTRVELVRADGSLVVIDGDQHPDLLDAVRIHLGLLGLVVKVTIETQPLRILTCTKATIGVDDFLSGFTDLNRKEEFCKAWWFPDTNLVHVWAASPAGASEIERYRANGEQLTDVEAAGDEDRLASTIYALEQKMAKDTLLDPAHAKSAASAPANGAGRQLETVQRFKRAVSVTGTMQQIYMKGIPVPQINCEIAVPLSQFQAAVHALANWLKTTKHELHYPFIFRNTGASRAWLAPHRGQELCYIGFLVYLSADGTAKPGSLEMMREIQQVLVPLGGTPHWGKHMCLDLYNMPRLFPRMTDFVRVMRAWDPKGKWQNEYTRDMLSDAVAAMEEEDRARKAAEVASGMVGKMAEGKTVVVSRRGGSGHVGESMSMRARL
ncbi:D-arabinono-1,4-lactone oxidase-domain-containing protein [Catenaria anguillulae PL171]|uniref:D-arabinono-1,4-lactone oxidase n=1 Tax=Catenaria anguillulae PL171 TaxID=765915 RepID=A0A1Y2HC55_9FUNG|nr:D-arabinono-1,4-lactone oxidase-domain-containing protein [Catenaria anguillulae PL171]